MKPKIFIPSFLAILLFSACGPTVDYPEQKEDVKTESTDFTNNTSNENSTTTNPETTQSDNPQYLAYSKTFYDENLGKEPMILFFHAPWCPTCLVMEKDFKDNLQSFPKGTKILEVDFDTETSLKSTYKIVSQSTIIIVDKEGKAVKTLAAPDSEELKKAIQETLN